MIPEILCLKDFLDAKPAERTYIVDGLLPRGGLSILSGQPKAGKSTLSRNMMRSIARGQTFLGRETDQVPILYYALEEIPYHIAAEFRLLKCRDEEIYIRAGPMDKIAISRVLKDDIRELSIGIAIVDPLFDVLSVSDSNSYTMVNDAMKSILGIARATDCHILAVHHTNKSDARGGNSILGSQALAGATECNMFLTLDGKGQRVLSSEQRSGTPFDRLILHFDDITHDVTAGESKATLRARQMQYDLLVALGNEELSTRVWLSKCRGRQEDKIAVIHQMADAGLVVKRTQGRADLWKQVV